MEAWSLRVSPHIFPTADHALFGRALLPADEHLDDLVIGVRPALERTGLTMRRLLELTEGAVEEELDGRTMPKAELAVLAAKRIAPQLDDRQQAAWAEPSSYGFGMTLGEAMVRFALYLLGPSGVLCFVQRRERSSPLMLVRQWLGRELDASDVENAGGELVRRYLRCYGPSTVRHFAEWAGVGEVHARKLWSRCEGSMVKVPQGRSAAFLMAEQAGELEASEEGRRPTAGDPPDESVRPRGAGGGGSRGRPDGPVPGSGDDRGYLHWTVGSPRMLSMRYSSHRRKPRTMSTSTGVSSGLG